MTFNYYNMALIGLIFGSITTLAMEPVAPSPRKVVPIPMLAVDYTQAESEYWQALIDAYNIATREDIVYVSKETGVPIKMVAATLDIELFFPFAAKLAQASESAHAILHAMREDNPQESEIKIINRIKTELGKTYLFKKANDYHVAVLVSDDPAIHDWLQREIQDSSKKTAIEQPTKNAYNLSPLFLAHLLNKQDLITLFKKSTADLGKPSRFHTKLLWIADESRKDQEKWIPSLPYRRGMMRLPNKEEHRQKTLLVIKNLQFDQKYRNMLKEADIRFYNWILNKQRELAQAEAPAQR